MSDQPVTQQFQFRRGFGFFFVFRISPGFFVGFVPRRSSYSSDYSTGYGPGYSNPGYDYDDQMGIQRISEQEFTFLRRIGVPEVSIMM
jgi:hypothetical protein